MEYINVGCRGLEKMLGSVLKNVWFWISDLKKTLGFGFQIARGNLGIYAKKRSGYIRCVCALSGGLQK